MGSAIESGLLAIVGAQLSDDNLLPSLNLDGDPAWVRHTAMMIL